MRLHALPQPFFSIDSEVTWPELSPCAGELGPGGEAIVGSEEGRAVLTLAPSGEEFSVQYTCSLSSSREKNHSTQPGDRESKSRPGAAADDDDTDEEQLGRRKRKITLLRSSTVQSQVRVLKLQLVSP